MTVDEYTTFVHMGRLEAVMRRLFPETQSRTYKSSKLSDPSQDRNVPGISHRGSVIPIPERTRQGLLRD